MPPLFSTFHLLFPLLKSGVSPPPRCTPATFSCPSSHSVVTEWPRHGGGQGGVEGGDRAGAKDAGAKEVGWGGLH